MKTPDYKAYRAKDLPRIAPSRLTKQDCWNLYKESSHILQSTQIQKKKTFLQKLLTYTQNCAIFNK